MTSDVKATNAILKQLRLHLLSMTTKKIFYMKLDLSGPLILERAPLRCCKCVGYTTFTISFRDIIIGHLAQHQERFYKGHLSITIPIP